MPNIEEKLEFFERACKLLIPWAHYHFTEDVTFCSALDRNLPLAQQSLCQHLEVIMLAYLFVIFAVLSRMPFMPHPWGFTPVAAALLYFGARGSRRQLWIPLALLAVSDVILTKFVYSYQFSWDHFVTWAWYAAILLLGTGLRENSGWLRVAGAALASSVSFFVVSNFAVWACWNMYPNTIAGLRICYAAGIPFFRRGLAGDLLFTAMMFGVPAIAALLARSVGKPHGVAAA